MSDEVKGLKVGQKIICVTFDSNNLPQDGGFHGWIVDHEVVEIISDTAIKIRMVKDPKKELTFDFKDDTINVLYTSPERAGWYTGIFTDMKSFFEQFNTIYAQVKGKPLVGENKEDPNNENQN